jgi:hypothetical protein
MELVRKRVRLTETETQYYMYQLVNSMAHLHGRNIIHRDLKLGNLFLNADLDIRIGDFGLAAQLENSDERKSTMCGTPNYIAPEILDRKGGGHSFEVDTWAMGVIMYTMLFGRPPFETSSVDTTYERIRGGLYTFPPNVFVSQAAKNMIQSILHSNAKERPTLQALKEHPFFTQSPFPSKLPISCLTKPFQWKHTCHPIDTQNGNGGGQQQENAGQSNNNVQQQQLQQLQLQHAQIPAMHVPVSTTTIHPPVPAVPTPRTVLATRTSTINNVLPPSITTQSDVQKPSANTAPVKPTATTAAPIAPVPTRPTTATAPLTTNTTPITSYTTRSTAAVITTTAAPAVAAPLPAPIVPSIAVPKRTSGGGQSTANSGTITERRVTRRTAVDIAAAATTTASISPAADDIDAAVAALTLGIGGTVAPVIIESGSAALQCAQDAVAEDEEEVGALRKMHDEIERSFCQPISDIPSTRSAAVAPIPSPTSLPTLPTLIPADVWVNKWVDYSNKYGLGYLLSNGSAGVYFNDSSKAILSAPSSSDSSIITEDQSWEYIERKHAPGSAAAIATQAAGVGERQCYTLSNFPVSLQKKVTLLRHFSSHLQKPSAGGSDTPDTNGNEPQVSRRSPPKNPAHTASFVPSTAGIPASPASAISNGTGRDSTGGLIYVKKWLRTKHAIFFRLSNRTVQVIFQDHTELVLSSLTNCVTYTDKNRRRETCSMDRTATSGDASNDPVQDRPDLAKRMKYTKEILHLLLSRSGTTAVSNAA